MADPKRRRQRIREGFPSAYDTRPGESALGNVLAALADALTELDRETEALLRERWPLHAKEPGSLAHQARLIGARTLGKADESDVNHLRQRVLMQARLLRSGLASPEAVLALALSALGLELCPKRGAGSVEGAREGFGLTPGSRSGCEACATSREGDCAFKGKEKNPITLELVENAPELRSHTLRNVAPTSHFSVDHDSLGSARPELRITPTTTHGLSWPALFRGNEILFLAAHLKQGETLVVQPAQPNRAGEAWREVGSKHIGSAKEDLYYFSVSDCFAPDDATAKDNGISRFADNEGNGACFAQFNEEVLLTPLLTRGRTRWTFAHITQDWIDANMGDLPAERPSAPAPLAPTDGERADLTLTSEVRPPSSFKLRVPRNTWMMEQPEGTLRLLQEMVELARPAGVRASFDFYVEATLFDEGPGGTEGPMVFSGRMKAAESQRAVDQVHVGLELSIREQHPEQRDVMDETPGAGPPLFAGVFADDADPPKVGTRQDLSHFPRLEETDE